MTDDKALALPVNMLVFLAIAVIVLLSAVAWFMTSFSGPAGRQEAQQQFRSCCSLYVQNVECNPDPQNFPQAGSACGTDDQGDSLTLADLARQVGISGRSNIRDACNCP